MPGRGVVEFLKVGGAVALEPLLHRVLENGSLRSGVESFSGDDQDVAQTMRVAGFHKILHHPNRLFLRLAVQVNGFVRMLGRGFAWGGEQVVRKFIGVPVRKLRVPEGRFHQTVIVCGELEGEARGGLVTHDGSEVVAGGEGVVEALLFVHLAAADEAQLCAKAEVRERDHEELGTTEGFEDGASFAS